MTIILLFLFGIIMGSFISAITWRLPRGINFWSDRSKCDYCKAKISWYDNIPLFSFFFLGGKCRNCGKIISLRYPLLELTTGILFSFIYLSLVGCRTNPSIYQSILCTTVSNLNNIALPYLLLVSVVMIAIFVTDFELQLIPDELVFLILSLSLTFPLLFFGDSMYEHLLAGFSGALFLLLLNIGTKGKGMGLGDVKLALFAGSFFGFKGAVLWLFISFVLGAIIGLILVFAGSAKMGKQIAFGPFLVVSFFAVLFFGNNIGAFLMPYW